MKPRFRSMVLSLFLWGSGQFLVGKQKAKGLLFFGLQCFLIGIELFTGFWIEYFEGLIDHFSIRLHGGVFTRGIWGFVTLGVKAGVKTGDHSAMLMINGIICIMVLGMFLGFYIWNVRDAYRAGVLIEEKKEIPTGKQYLKRLWSEMFAYIVLAPMIVLFLFIVVMPIIFSILTAFTNYSRDHLPPRNLIDWVGFDNFRKLFSVPVWSKTFLAVLRWTVIWAVSATFSTFFFGLFQALILNDKLVKGKKIFQTIFILPWAMPNMVILIVFKSLLNGQFGPINQFLLKIGLIDQYIPFLSDPLITKITVIIVNLWMAYPVFMVMILGVLANQDQSLMEAAAVDGANRFQVFFKIKLPLLMQATAPLLVMNFAGNFNGFGAVYFLTEGGPVNSAYQFAGETDILITWIYKLTLNQQMYSMAAVMNILIFLFVGGISFWNFKRTTAFKEA